MLFCKLLLARLLVIKMLVGYSSCLIIYLSTYLFIYDIFLYSVYIFHKKCEKEKMWRPLAQDGM